MNQSKLKKEMDRIAKTINPCISQEQFDKLINDPAACAQLNAEMNETRAKIDEIMGKAMLKLIKRMFKSPDFKSEEK